MLPRTTSFKSEKWLKRVTFNVGGPVLARDFRPGQTWTAGTVVGRRGSVLYEVQVNSEIWIRHRNQLEHGKVENSTAPSMPWSLLLDTFRLPTQENPRASESPQKTIDTTTEENPKAAEKTASGSELKVLRGKRSLKRGRCQGENTKYVCGRSRISLLNIFPWRL